MSDIELFDEPDDGVVTIREEPLSSDEEPMSPVVPLQSTGGGGGQSRDRELDITTPTSARKTQLGRKRSHQKERSQQRIQR